MPPEIPPNPSQLTPDPPRKPARSWAEMKRHAKGMSGVITLIVGLLIIGGAVGFLTAYFNKKSPATTTNQPTVQTLTPDQLRKLTDISANLGNSNQTLNIGANALFRGTVNVTSDLTVGGHFNANGPVTLSQLNISGTTALSGLNVGSNLIVAGQTTLQKGVSIEGLANVNGNINVTGSVNAGAVNASTISVKTLSITGPLIISHIQTQGATPAISPGSAIGAGGTVNVGGNDTTGTVNVNTGGSPGSGALAYISFRSPYSSSVHVLISPLTGASAGVRAYVSRSSQGFQIVVDSPPPGGTVLSFDYIVTQ